MTTPRERFEKFGRLLYDQRTADVWKHAYEDVEQVMSHHAGKGTFTSGRCWQDSMSHVLAAAKSHLESLVQAYAEAAANEGLPFTEVAEFVRAQLDETAGRVRERVLKEHADVSGRCFNAENAALRKQLENEIDELLRQSKNLIDIEALRRGPHATAHDPPELADSLGRFLADHPTPSRCAFIMMKITEQVPADKDPAVLAIREVCEARGIKAVRADEKEYHGSLWENVLTYMHGAGFGIAIIPLDGDSPNTQRNVASEIGGMSTLKKHVCLLKPKAIAKMPADMMGKLWREFDDAKGFDDMKRMLNSWLVEKELGDHV